MPNPTERVDLDDLVSVIETLQGLIKRHDETIGSFKYRTRMLLIDPLLDALGWDTSDPAMVNPDYHAGYGKEGYALLGRAQGARSDEPIAFIEAKQLSADIVDADRVRALINARITGATYVGLTNGDRWEFYDVFSQSSIDDRRILSISIRYQGALNCARELVSTFLRLTESTGGPTVESARRRSRTYYDELDVEPSASSVDIRKAFLRRVKQLHPDVSKRSQANRETARLNHVYAILSNQQLRREYDAIILPREPDNVTPPTVEREPRAETTSRNKDNKRHTKSKTTSRKTGPARSRRGSAQSSTGSRQAGPGRRQSRRRSRQWQARRNFGFWRKARWLAARLIVIAMLVTAAVIGYHWYSGTPLGVAVEMMTEDYRLAAACPTDPGAVLGFLGRAPYPDNYSRMSVRYPDGWEAQVCNGDLAYDRSTGLVGVPDPAQTVAPLVAEVTVPDAQATATPITQPTVEAPVRRSVPTPPTVSVQDTESGMRVDEVTMDATGLVGKVNILVTNVLDEDCTSLVMNVDLLNAEGELVAQMTIGGSGPLPAGQQKRYEERYVGSTVSEARVGAMRCEITAASGFAPTPMPAATNTPAPIPTATYTPRPSPPATRGVQDVLEATSSQKYVGGSPLNRGEIERWVIEFTNEERISAGLRPLHHDDAISDIARSHSENMARLGLLSHDIGGSDPTDRAIAAGYNCRAYSGNGSYSYGLSENIFEHPRVIQWMGQGRSYNPVDYNRDAEDMARSLVQGWMTSPGHRENILNMDSRRIGVGIAIQESPKYGYINEIVYATQNFSACK